MKNLEDLILENKDQLIDEFPILTEKDFENTNKDEIAIHLTTKLGKTKDELRDIVMKL